MKNSVAIAESSKTLLAGWERALLVLPALAALALGVMLSFLPGQFAALSGFPAAAAYIYRLAGAAILGYGVALSVGLFQQEWLPVRLVVIGILVNNLGSLYACLIALFSGSVPYSVYLFLATNLLFIAICSLVLARHSGVPHAEQDFASPVIRVLLVVGILAAGAFGIFPLFVPNLFTLFHLHINAPFIIREAGAGSLGYAVAAVLTSRSLSRKELPFVTVMVAIFNGVGGLVSIPYLSSNILLLPWVIMPVGLLVMVACVFVLRQLMAGRAR